MGVEHPTFTMPLLVAVARPPAVPAAAGASEVTSWDLNARMPP